MARLSPPCQSLYRGLRVSGLRKGDDSPLRTVSRPARPAICRARRLPTQRLCRCVHSDTCQTRSPRYVSASHAHWFMSCRDAHAADGRASGRLSKLSDAVGLEGAIASDAARFPPPLGLPEQTLQDVIEEVRTQ